MLTTTTIQRSAHRSLITSYPRKQTRQQGGFTIVELLLVIVIIAILATITIVAFNGIQDRARASAVSAALNQVSKKLELYSVDNGGYPATLSDAGVNDSNNVSYQYTASTAPSATYCTTATQGSTSYYISNTTKTPTKGGCPGHGQGGVAAVTNLATNPSVEGGSYAPNRPYGGVGSGDNTTAASGTSSMLVTATGATWTGGIWPAPVSGPGVYTCGISLKSLPDRSVTVSLRAETSSWGYIGEGMGAKAVNLTSAWQRVTVTANVSAANLGILSIQFNTQAVVAGDRFWADAVICTQGSTTYNYADGSSPNWVWNGAANASTSTGPPL